MTQQGDVKIVQVPDGGEITVVNGIVTMSGGLETAAYLSLFGGNQRDDGRDDSPFSWWGNLIENEPEKQYRSETQHLLEALPLVTSNLRRIEEAALRDLAWFLEVDAASEVTALATIPAPNRIQLDVGITAFGEESQFQFVENWRSNTEAFTPEEVDGVASVDQTYLLLESGDNLLLESGDLFELEVS